MKLRFKPIKSEGELNLNPMMDVFVGLLPFLIVSSAWMQLGALDLKTPAIQANAAEEQKNDADQSIWLEVYVEKEQVSIMGYTASFSRELAQHNRKFDIRKPESLQDFVKSLKEKNKLGPSLFHASQDTTYEQAAQVLKVLRAKDGVPEVVMAAGAVR